MAERTTAKGPDEVVRAQAHADALPENGYELPAADSSGEGPETDRKELPMSTTNITNWIRTGLLALPVYGLLTFWSTLHPQPDQDKDPEAWARFVSTPSYLMSHLFGSIGGTILGVFALGAYLAKSRAGRLGMVATVMTVLGQALLLVIGGISTFATPAIGRAYLEGTKAAMGVEFPSAMMPTFLVGILLALVGSVLLGVAIWRSGTLPRWSGIVWIASAVMFYVLGVVLGQATTGASLVTQPIASLLVVFSGGWIAFGALRRPSGGPASVQARPRVR
jgi:hypothetical protein